MSDEYTDDGTPVGARRINWGATATDKPKYELIPPGKYHGEIFLPPDLSFTRDGAECIAITIRITDEPFVGRRLTDRFYVTDKALWRLRNFLWTLGFSEEQLDPTNEMLIQDAEDTDGNLIPGLLSMLEAFVNEEVMITVIHEVYNGEKQVKIRETRGLRQAGYPPRIYANGAEANAANALKLPIAEDELPF